MAAVWPRPKTVNQMSQRWSGQDQRIPVDLIWFNLDSSAGNFGNCNWSRSWSSPTKHWKCTSVIFVSCEKMNMNFLMLELRRLVPELGKYIFSKKAMFIWMLRLIKSVVQNLDPSEIYFDIQRIECLEDMKSVGYCRRGSMVSWCCRS